MSLVPQPLQVQRLYSVDAKGSGLIMYRDKLGVNLFAPLRTLVPGKMLDATRIADTELVLIPGAQVLATDTSVLWESNGTIWTNTSATVSDRVAIVGTMGGTNVLSASILSTYTGNPAYQWRRNGVAIAGATSATYAQVPGTDDVSGTSIDCVVSGITFKYGSNVMVVAPVVSAPAPAPAPGPQPTYTTNPKFGYGPANNAGNASVFDAMFPSFMNLTGSQPGGRTGTFSTQSSITNYTWIAVLASSVGNGMHVFDGTGTGGFDGANSPGAFTGLDADPMIVFKTYTDSDGNLWNIYRSDAKAVTFSTFTLS